MAGGRGKIHEHPNQTSNGFDKNPQNINRNGRKKKIYTVLKEKGYSIEDTRAAFGELAYYDESELKSVQNDQTKPIITRIVAKQFLEAFEKGNWTKIREIMEHTIGKPDQNINASGDFTTYHVEHKFVEPDGSRD